MKKIISKMCCFFFMVSVLTSVMSGCSSLNLKIKQSGVPNNVQAGVEQTTKKNERNVTPHPVASPPKEKTGIFHIETVPADAQIRILNIKPKYYPDMALKEGDYEIEVSKPGYHTVTKWVPLLPAIENKVEIRLDKKESPVKFLSKNNAYALIIGISRYQYLPGNETVNVMLSDDDAMSFQNLLVQKGWDRGNIKMFIDENATKNDIHIALASWLMKAGPEDTVIVFWSGCIYPDPISSKNSYFTCYDTNTSMPQTGYSFNDMVSSLIQKQTARVILITDLYNLGAGMENGSHTVSLKASSEKLKSEKKLPEGWAFFLGEMWGKPKKRSSSWPNSPFTHFLLAGLRGAADSSGNLSIDDGHVTINELVYYLKSEMPDETKKVYGVSIVPSIVFSGGKGALMDVTLDIRQ